MAINEGIYGHGFNFEKRFFKDHEALANKVQHLKDEDLKIVLTMGSFDLLHIGHARYLMAAKSLGDVLIVGIETDSKVRSRKEGDHRPVLPQDERYEMVCHTRYVDIVTYKDVDDEKWKLIKLLRPDVLQAVVGTYTDEQLEELKQYCGDIVVQERQATTSTSQKIRLLVIAGVEKLAQSLSDSLPKFVTNFFTKEVEKMNERFSEQLPAHVNEVVTELKENGKL